VSLVPEATLDGDTYRARIRSRVANKLSVADSKCPFREAGREVLLQASTEGASIQDNAWLVISTRGFADDANPIFGRHLQTSDFMTS